MKPFWHGRHHARMAHGSITFQCMRAVWDTINILCMHFKIPLDNIKVNEPLHVALKYNYLARLVLIYVLIM